METDPFFGPIYSGASSMLGAAVDALGRPVTPAATRPKGGAFIIRCGLLFRRGQGTLKSLPEVPNKWALLSRYFIRNPAYSAIFSVCLHSYMVKMEQDRGTRNANYKSMTNAASSYLASMNAMSTFLTQNMAQINVDLTRLLAPEHHCLHIYFVDWHWIASELPVGHRRFLPYKEDIDNPDRQEEEADIPQTRMEDDSD